MLFESQSVYGRSFLHPALLLASVQRIRRHQAIGSPERGVGDDKVIYAPSRIVTAQEAIGFEENVRLLAVHPPFHNRARKVPRDVSWTRKEMVIAVAA